MPGLYRRCEILILCLLLVGLIAGAQAQPSSSSDAEDKGFTETFPPLPPADRYDLAQRFYGITPDAIPSPVERSSPQVGDVQTFSVSNTERNQQQQVTAELRAVGEHLYVWAEQGLSLADSDLQAFVRQFDTAVYEPTRALWGSENSPGIDGDLRLHLLITDEISNFVGGYYADANSYPQSIVPGSNEREMFVFHADTFRAPLAQQVSIAAHEFQHMIRSHVDPNEQGWLDEGFSMLTEYLLRLGDNRREVTAFRLLPQTQLTTWTTDAQDTSPDYGASFLFTLYFYERFGAAALRDLSTEPLDGMAGVDAVIQQYSQTTDAASFFADWVLANALLLPDNRYGYRSLPPNLVPVAQQAMFTAYPDRRDGRLPPYATHYYTLQNTTGSMRVSLDVPPTISLIPADNPADNLFWYSQRGDVSNPRLTRAFDLRDLSADDAPTLDYRIWYDLETDWDYAYISISRDGGTSWTLQTTNLTTTANPNQRAYGTGYTGDSGGWQRQTIALAPYAGDHILVRFEMVTDDAFNHPGIALDDVTLAALDYRHTADTVGEWQADGFIRTDNRVPLRLWVQLAQMTADGIDVVRESITGDTAWTHTIVDPFRPVMVAVSPIAPLSTEDIAYTIRFDALD